MSFELTRLSHWKDRGYGYSGVITCVGLTVPESLDMELPVLPDGWEWGQFMRMRDAKEGPVRKVIFWRSDTIIHFDCHCTKEVWETREENCPIKIIKAAAEEHAQKAGKLKGKDWLAQWINLLDR